MYFDGVTSCFYTCPLLPLLVLTIFKFHCRSNATSLLYISPKNKGFYTKLEKDLGHILCLIYLCYTNLGVRLSEAYLMDYAFSFGFLGRAFQWKDPKIIKWHASLDSRFDRFCFCDKWIKKIRIFVLIIVMQ